MKKLNYLLSAVILLAVLATVGCGSDDKKKNPSPTPTTKDAEKELLKKFGKKWTLTSATLGGNAVTDMAGFTLTLTTGKSYSTNAATMQRKPNPWPASGTFSFVGKITKADASSFKIKRSDGLEINVDRTDTKLTLSFTFDKTKHKGSKVSGAWKMVFKK